MIPNHYMKNGCFTKHSFKTVRLGLPVGALGQFTFLVSRGDHGEFFANTDDGFLHVEDLN